MRLQVLYTLYLKDGVKYFTTQETLILRPLIDVKYSSGVSNFVDSLIQHDNPNKEYLE